ncbi:MAG TPA: S46 family peptidase [Tenuifilaceae bacterium]|nr:S46 family peptidase [Tenuifilaceae bacterium]
MKKRLLVLVAGFFFMFGTIAKADEGMWLLPLLKQLNIDAMQQKGFKLTAEDIYNVNNSSLKDAVIIFGGGCTGEMISDKGLILTNHHCGYGAIQQHSTPEHDYLADGFWAKTIEEEIPTPGLSATFLVRLEDVTAKVNEALNASMSEPERNKAIAEVGKKIETEATAGTHYRGMVRSYFGGNQFFLLVYEVFTDVRMVGAPPSSIGKFGADTDNWMWPRHTGDFSIFRVYANKDNKPANYSKENVPFTPKHSLPISIKGVKKGDFAMIMGYPGRTQRYMTSMEVDEHIKISNTNRIFIRGIRQDILLKDMLADKAINIKYASKYAGSSNYWKNSIGMNKALKRLKVYDYKKANEEEFMKWVNANPERVAKYGDALNLINDAVAKRKDHLHATQYYGEVFRASTELISFASIATQLVEPLKSGKKEDIDKVVNGIKNRSVNFYKNYSASTDRKVTKTMFKVFADNVPAQFQPDIYQTINGKYKKDYDKFVDDIFNKSIFVDSTKLYAFLAKPNLKALEKDPAFVAAQSIVKKSEDLYKVIEPLNYQLQKGQRLFIAGILDMNQGKAMYPDANSTMRLTYGEVLDYYPMNAVHYDYITTLDGVMEKEDPDNWEFVVPQKLKDLYNAKDYGRYGENGKMPLAFISTNDITGGNSGSPVINANGELIGCAFDGNWEAMSGDIVFEKNLQRTISVDIRYVLFIIDKYAGATRLIDEMKIIE